MRIRRLHRVVPDSGQPEWRRRMRSQIAWSLLAKLAALALLWWLFFSGSHQTHVTPDAVSRQLGMTGAP